MSRIGKKPITVLDKVSVNITSGGIFGGYIVDVTGPKGQLKQDIRPEVSVELSEDKSEILVTRKSDDDKNRAYQGLYRTLINNMVNGVVSGYEQNLEVHGVGYRVKLNGNTLELTLGRNHPIHFKAPEGIEFAVEGDNNIKIKGIDKQLVGLTAAKVRMLRKPEPYKGKGIRYQGEQVRRKVGKAASK